MKPKDLAFLVIHVWLVMTRTGPRLGLPEANMPPPPPPRPKGSRQRRLSPVPPNGKRGCIWAGASQRSEKHTISKAIVASCKSPEHGCAAPPCSASPRSVLAPGCLTSGVCATLRQSQLHIQILNTVTGPFGEPFWRGFSPPTTLEVVPY